MKKNNPERRRRVAFVAIIAILIIGAVFVTNFYNTPQETPSVLGENIQQTTSPAYQALGSLAIKDRAAHNGYSRSQFGSGWANVNGCDMRNQILRRDMTDSKIAEDGCIVLSGTLNDPYTAKTINFIRGKNSSSDVQIDHVVALSNAWQTGAQSLTSAKRQRFANDPLNLLAVDGPTNMKKSDSDAANWLPNKIYACRYVARQIAVKIKYLLWVTQAEFNTIAQVLQTCPGQVLPIEVKNK